VGLKRTRRKDIRTAKLPRQLLQNRSQASAHVLLRASNLRRAPQPVIRQFGNFTKVGVKPCMVAVNCKSCSNFVATCALPATRSIGAVQFINSQPKGASQRCATEPTSSRTVPLHRCTPGKCQRSRTALSVSAPGRFRSSLENHPASQRQLAQPAETMVRPLVICCEPQHPRLAFCRCGEPFASSETAPRRPDGCPPGSTCFGGRACYAKAWSPLIIISF